MAINIDDFIAAQEEAKSYASRFTQATSEYRKTGNWMGKTYGVNLGSGPNRTPADYTKEFIDADFSEEEKSKYFSDEAFSRRTSEIQDDVGKAGFRAERKTMRISQNITDVEDFTQEEWKALVTRNQELKTLQSSDNLEFEKVFRKFDQSIPGTNENLSYLIHSGSPELQGGKLDPSFTQGTILGRGGAGDTRAANDSFVNLAKNTLRQLEENPDFDPKAKQSIKRQLEVIEEGGGYMSATKPTKGIADGYFGRMNWQRSCKIKGCHGIRRLSK